MMMVCHSGYGENNVKIKYSGRDNVTEKLCNQFVVIISLREITYHVGAGRNSG